MTAPTNPRLTLTTSHGDIVLELDAVRAPKTAAHFLKLARDGLLGGSTFYRVVHPNLETTPPQTIDVIQGGVGWDLCGGLPGVEHEPTDQSGLSHRDGTISLARSADTEATSEFFICIGDQPILDAGSMSGPAAIGFAAFGQVVEGMEAVRAIHALPADAPPPGGDVRFQGQFLDEPVAIAFR